MSQALTAALPAEHPLGSVAEGEQLVTHLVQVMDTLLGTVEEETRLVREGKLRAASELAQPKADLAKHYIADVIRVKANQGFLNQTMPTVLESLKQHHDQFRALLQINLTVLATAHAVSEGIVRGVSDEMARRNAPSTYGASGRAMAAPKTSYQPMAVSRSL